MSIYTPFVNLAPEVLARAFLHYETRKVDKAGCISFMDQKYEVGLNFIGCTVDVCYDPRDISELTIEYPGHEPWSVRKLVIGPRAGQRPRYLTTCSPSQLARPACSTRPRKKPRSARLARHPRLPTAPCGRSLGRLTYAAQRQWFAVLTGDAGTGKTTTIRRLAEELDPVRFKLLYVADSKLTPRHGYKGLLEQLGCEAKFYRGDAKRQLHRESELMRGMHGLQPVVVVDEAHLLDREMLEEIRFLLLCRVEDYAERANIRGGCAGGTATDG